MDKLFWRYPEAKFLMNSPVVSLLRWVESQMTLFATTGIKDDYPLMQPVLINQAVESASSVSEFVYEH